MYEVRLYSNYSRINPMIIHSHDQDSARLDSGSLHLVLDGIDQFDFTINPNNPAYQKITPISSHIEVIDRFRNRSIFFGRIRKIGNTMQGWENSYSAESVLSYLYDGYQVFRKLGTSTVEAFFREVITQHNRTVEPYKRFKVKQVTVTSPSDNLYRGLSYDSTLNILKDRLLSRLGGYLVINPYTSPIEISYLANIGHLVSTSPLEVGLNVLTANKTLDTADIVTRLIPTGAEIEQKSGAASEIHRPRVNISSVNGGKDYLDDNELIREFGIIAKVESWTDVHVPSLLKTKGLNWLKQQKKFLTSWSISAANLSLVQKSIEDFDLGNSYPVRIPLLGAEENVKVIEKKIDLLHPEASEISLGDKYKTLSKYQSEVRRAQKDLKNLAQEWGTRSIDISALKDKTEKQQAEIEALKNRLNDLTGAGPWKGADVSKYNMSIDWPKFKNVGHSFVMVRAGFGQVTFDPLADMHVKNAAAQGLAIGLYWFSYAKNTAEAIQEANAICDFADKYNITYPIAWDWENDSERYVIAQGVTPTKKLVSDMALAFLNRVKERGYKAMNYSNKDYYDRYFDDRVKAFDWWLARPNVKEPDVPCTIWQHELDVDGTSRGINGNADFNISYKDYRKE